MLCSVPGKEEEPDTPRTKKTWLIEAKVWHWERIGKLPWKYLLEKKDNLNFENDYCKLLKF